jgi:TRAP transporter 4TM/12TM fusion protein
MVVNVLVCILLIATSLFSIYANVFSLMPPLEFRGIFWGAIAVLVFLTSRQRTTTGRRTIDVALAVVTGLCTLVLVARWEEFASGIHDPTPFEVAVGMMMIVLVLEATRRTIGWFLAGVTIVFILFGLLGNYIPGPFVSKGYSVARISSFLFWDATGIYGLPMYIAASYVMLFVIFGAFLLKSGGEKWFMDLSFAAVGRWRGGPALTAVISSAMFGMMSGSPVANVVTTGSFTIPLMKEIGFKPYIAGAIEAVASTGGMFTPPIMGAAAFLMAEYVGIPYVSIALAAAIPAFLFYVSLMITIYIRALRGNLPSMSRDRIPSLRTTLRRYGHLMPPIFVLLGLLLSGRSLLWSAFWSIVSMVALAMLRKHTRLSVRQVGDALQDATQKAMPVTVACAAAGIIYGIISLTGLGFRVSSLLLQLAGGNPILMLVFTMGSSLLLGFAMPPTAAYIILAALVIPSLIKIGLLPLVAHMFLFFFCSIGPITPPVALAAYSAAALAKSDPNRTGFAAFRFGLPAFIIPFLFVYAPSLLLMGSPTLIVGSVVKAMIMLASLTFSIEGHFMQKLSWPERILFLVIIAANLHPDAYVNIAGIVAFGVLGVLGRYRSSRMRSNRP